MKLTILGAGWLGFELAKSLKDEYKIVVSSRDEEKLKIYEDEGFSSYILNEQNFDYIEELLNTDFLFINFPPSKFENYLSFLEKIYSSKNISNIKKSYLLVQLQFIQIQMEFLLKLVKSIIQVLK
ncbi:NAD(P)-binding domain-containing protein [Aliarcobacter butzleri]|uniref:NAD(P)-binding domain-containing protein n=1 Tax=Aliarcobacter butzleri TaxID=28197 RepID=UPI003AFB125A